MKYGLLLLASIYAIYFAILSILFHWFQEIKDLARPGFITDDTDNDLIDEIDEDSDGEDGLFDSVCAICDNGGELLWYVFSLSVRVILI